MLVPVVQRVPQFVQAQVGVGAKLAGRIKGVLFEEAANITAAAEKIVVGDMAAFAAIGREDSGLLRWWHQACG